MEQWNLGHGIIEKILLFDDHKSSDKDKSISTTTLIGPNWKAQRDLLKDIPIKLEQVPMMRRSSTIGTGYHERAFKIFAYLNPNALTFEQSMDIYGTIPDKHKELVYEEYIKRKQMDRKEKE